MEKKTIEEQFKETLNNEEIDRIEDPELRAILIAIGYID
jgi:hypothetical protein